MSRKKITVKDQGMVMKKLQKITSYNLSDVNHSVQSMTQKHIVEKKSFFSYDLSLIYKDWLKTLVVTIVIVLILITIKIVSDTY